MKTTSKCNICNTERVFETKDPLEALEALITEPCPGCKKELKDNPYNA